MPFPGNRSPKPRSSDLNTLEPKNSAMPNSSLGFRKLQMERVRCADPALRNAIPREPITEATNTRSEPAEPEKQRDAEQQFGIQEAPDGARQMRRPRLEKCHSQGTDHRSHEHQQHRTDERRHFFPRRPITATPSTMVTIPMFLYKFDGSPSTV